MTISHRNWLIALVFAILAACGAPQEMTPEPGDTEAIKALTRKLGLTPSWTDRLLNGSEAKTERADGVILYDWLRRREATLEGTLEVYQTPAFENPGKVTDTLAWERKTQAQDQQTQQLIGTYWDMLERRQPDCPRLTRREARWFSEYEDVHAQGVEGEDVNWALRTLALTTPCAEEKSERAAAGVYDRSRTRLPLRQHHAKPIDRNLPTDIVNTSGATAGETAKQRADAALRTESLNN